MSVAADDLFGAAAFEGEFFSGQRHDMRPVKGHIVFRFGVIKGNGRDVGKAFSDFEEKTVGDTDTGIVDDPFETVFFELFFKSIFRRFPFHKIHISPEVGDPPADAGTKFALAPGPELENKSAVVRENAVRVGVFLIVDVKGVKECAGGNTAENRRPCHDFGAA